MPPLRRTAELQVAVPIEQHPHVAQRVDWLRAAEPQPAEPTSGTETATPAAQATTPPPGQRSENLSALQPNVTVYVEGPTRTTTDAVSAGGTSDFEITVHVTNDGETDLAIDQLAARFEVWSETDERTPCTLREEDDAPDEAEEDDSTSWEVTATCTFPTGGRYQVNSYVAFEGEAFAGDFDIERYYAGTTEVVIGE